MQQEIASGQVFTVEYVQNSTGRGQDSKTLYRARLNSIEASRAIRNKFSTFFAGGKDARPPAVASISIRNCVTTATLARIAILQLLGQRYKDSNPGSRFHVVGYEPRPLLKLTPSPTSSDKRVRTFNFIEAISSLPTSFSSKEIEALLKRISPKLHGNLRSLFVVVNEDMLTKKFTKSKKAPSVNSVPLGSGSESSPGVASPEFHTPDNSSLRSGKRLASSPSGPSAKGRR